MANSRKVILFLVEGVSEEEAFAELITNIIKNDKVAFKIISGDITSDRRSRQQNIKRKINDKIKQYMMESKIHKSDILSVVQLMDIDGAYIDDEKFIIIDSKISKGFDYYPDSIHGKSKKDVMIRNTRKSSIINVLCSSDEMSGINYRTYYFCCNLDHVLYNKANLKSRHKVEYAQRFQDKYYDNEEEFIKFICDSEFTVHGDYKETWEFLKKDLNSLGRYSNFNLFFHDFRSCIKDKYKQ